MDSDSEIAIRESFDGKGVVKILGIVGVDRECKEIAEIGASFEIAFSDAVGKLVGFAVDGFREIGIELKITENGFEFGSRFPIFSENLDDFAFGVDVSLFPFVKFDDDLVADLGRRLQFGGSGSWDENIGNDSRIVGDDKVKEAAFLKATGDRCSSSFEDADDAAASFVGIAAVTRMFSRSFESDDDAVIVESDAGILGADKNRWRHLSVCSGRCDDECGAALAELDLAADEAGISGDDQT